MRCLVTCGPTYEPLDQVRRLTNFSTGSLGVALSNFLVDAGHTVTLFRGYYSTCREAVRAQHQVEFTTTANLLDAFRTASSESWHLIFHAAAVSDFTFGQVFRRSPADQLDPLSSGKYSTRQGPLLAELVPTPKILQQLPSLFPHSKICGWKYEVEGSRDSVLDLARQQVNECKTHFCVANGRAYGDGFGLVGAHGLLRHSPTREDLFNSFQELLLT